MLQRRARSKISIHDRSLEIFNPEGCDRICSIPGPSELERNADNSGRDFFFGGGAEILEKQGPKIHGKISPSNSLRNSPAILLKFARPKYKIHPKSALPNLGLKIFSIADEIARNFRSEKQIWPFLIAKCIATATVSSQEENRLLESGQLLGTSCSYSM